MVATCNARQNGGGSEAGMPAVTCKEHFGTNDLFVVGESNNPLFYAATTSCRTLEVASSVSNDGRSQAVVR